MHRSPCEYHNTDVIDSRMCTTSEVARIGDLFPQPVYSLKVLIGRLNERNWMEQSQNINYPFLSM